MQFQHSHRAQSYALLMAELNPENLVPDSIFLQLHILTLSFYADSWKSIKMYPEQGLRYILVNETI